MPRTPAGAPGAIAHVRTLRPPVRSGAGIEGPAGQLVAATPARVVAWVTDTVVLTVILIALLELTDRLLGPRIGIGIDTQSLADGASVILPRVAIDVAVVGLYFVVLWTGGRRTVGMRLLGIRVLRADGTGPIDVRSAIARYAVMELPGFAGTAIAAVAAGSLPELLSWTAAVWTLVLLASVVRDPLRRGLHDRVARSIVVSA